jgi:hypothetical protein
VAVAAPSIATFPTATFTISMWVRLPASDAATGTSDSGGASSCFFQYGSTDNPDQITVCVERSHNMIVRVMVLDTINVVIDAVSLGECCRCLCCTAALLRCRLQRPTRSHHAIAIASRHHRHLTITV